MIYLDYAATAPVRREVLEEMTPYFSGVFANPDSVHEGGRRAALALTRARDEIASVLGVSAGEVYFSSGGTEADNWAVRKMGEGRALVSNIEHAAVLSSAPLREGGHILVPVERDGRVSLGRLKSSFQEDVGLVCLMCVNNETGCVQDLAEASKVCKERGALLFSDCVQAAMTQDLKEVLKYADAIALSSHKVGGPKGVGALILKKGKKISPLIVGGEQERHLRGGTVNVAGVVGFARALSLAQEERESFCAHIKALKSLFEEGVKKIFGGSAKIDGEGCAPNISHITFEKGETYLKLLDLKGVAASSGAACSARAALPSHVMTAMGRSEEEALSGIRFSFGAKTTKKEILQTLAILREIKKG